MLFKSFEWDDRNINHILRHAVFPGEAEESCIKSPYVRRTMNNRYLVYGVTEGGRHLFIVGINKGKGIFRVITARDMTEREKSLYKRRLRK